MPKSSLGPSSKTLKNPKLPSAKVTLGPSNPWPFSGSGGKSVLPRKGKVQP
jgi:hypothetical protein